MGAMKGLLNMDNVQIILTPYACAAIGDARQRRTRIVQYLEQQGANVTFAEGNLHLTDDVTIDGKPYCLSFPARDWLNGERMVSDAGRSVVPLGIIVDFASRYIMLAL